MHRIFQNYIDHLSNARDSEGLRDGMAEAAAALDLSCFAYLSVPKSAGDNPRLISNYPSAWTKLYLQQQYERFDPVIMRALHRPEPFGWGLDVGLRKLSDPQRELFEEAAKFGIRHGFTIPIHDGRGPIAAMTFATDERRLRFDRTIKEYARVLQLMAIYFHTHARRKIGGAITIGNASLSPREAECLEWAAEGKSAWAIGRILGISRHTAATYLENAKAKLGVRTIVQAVACFTAGRPTNK